MTKNQHLRRPVLAARFTMIGLSLCAVPSCGLDLDPHSDPLEPGQAQSTSPSPPSFAEFLHRAQRLADGRLIIDADILVENEVAARAYYDTELRLSAQSAPASPVSGLGTLAQSLTVQVVGGMDSLWPLSQRMELRYCVNGASFGSNASLLTQTLEQAAYSWSRRIGIAFRRVDEASCNNTTNSVVFNVRQEALGGAFASSFFPEYSRSGRELLIDASAFTTTSGGRDLLGILGHELGHALGARHEHIWLASPCATESTSSARQVTAYDADSIMHYPQCRPSGGGGYRQSALDYAGMYTLYGLAPALVMSLK